MLSPIRSKETGATRLRGTAQIVAEDWHILGTKVVAGVGGWGSGGG